MNNFTVPTVEENDGLKAFNTAAVAFEQELENVLVKLAKKGDSLGNVTLLRKDSFSRLFKEFKPRLQHKYYAERLMQIGTFLCSVKAFRMAKFQCFTRYLQEIYPNFTNIEEVATYSLEEYRKIFFPKGLDDDKTIDTIKVLCEDTMCSYQLLKESDPKLLNSASVVRCEKLLKILQLTTQLALHSELLSWIVYNGTIHMYTISRHLMVTGSSMKVLEYLLWACMCMEASIPLLTVKYLPWRSTLYAAVSLCYLDCKELHHAESFARRAMKKIIELADIEEISTSVASPQTKLIFQSAKVKINVIIFQRVVFELRKRPKGLLRPKARPPLKEALQANWPRSQTERLLSDLFEGSASQFLAILQTLGDPHRRTLQCKAPTGAIDDITLDIYPELFVAGVDLVSGGNTGTRGPRHEPDVHPSCLELSSMSLLDLSQQGSDGIPIPFVIQFVKLAFSYEQWDLLAVLLQPCIVLLKTSSGSQLPQTPAYLMALHLMVAMEPFCNIGRKHKKGLPNSESGNQESWIVNKSGGTVDDLMVIANIIHRSSSELPKSSLPYLDVDMVIDATLFLWARCKPYFQRVVSCNIETCRQVANDPDCDKWLYIVLTIHNVLHWSGLSDIDPVMTGEVALKLSFVLECRASSSHVIAANQSYGIPRSDTKQSISDEKSRSKEVFFTSNTQQPHHEETSQEQGGAKANAHGVFPSNANDLLEMAFKILEAGVERISEARDKMEGISNVSETTNHDTKESGENLEKVSSSRQTETSVQIMHLELLYNLTRLLVKLNASKKDSQSTLTLEKSKSSAASIRKQANKGKGAEEHWTAELVKKYKKNTLTKALLLMHGTQLGNVNNDVARQQLQECFDLVKKAQTQQKILSTKSNNSKTTETTEATALPPPPLLVYRNSSSIVLKPAPFKPLSREKVHWYRLFACSASGSNVKVRLNDSDLAGAGDEMPDGPDCSFHISNLREGERYVFAIAAYDKGGNLIGGGIGPTGYPIPASYAISTTMAWGYLAQAAYSCRVHDIAKASAQVLWKHFVPSHDLNSDENSSEKVFIAHGETDLNVIRCDEKLLANSNQALLRQFLQSIFITVDVNVHDNKLHCDSLCDYGPLLPGQVNRIKQCELMLLALQVALWLNDNMLVLQTVTRTYGLLAPLLQMKIPYKPVVKVLLQCYAVLQEVPSVSRFRKNTATSDSLYHLIAVVTYYLIKVLPLWGEQELATSISEYGQKVLAIDPPTADPDAVVTIENVTSNEGPTGKAGKGAGKKSKVGKATSKKKGGPGRGIKPELSRTTNIQSNQFIALEQYHLKMTCEAILSQRTEMELLGSEDPSVLNAYVAGMSTQDSFREVMRFKRRSKFLEYFVLVLEKAFAEENFEQIVEWSCDTDYWLAKRSDQLMPTSNASIIIRSVDAGDEVKQNKFATTIMEYGKQPTKKSQKTARQLLDSLHESRGGAAGGSVKHENGGVSGASGASTAVGGKARKDKRKKGKTVEEQNLINAIEVFQCRLPEFWKNEARRKRLRVVTNEELPWRCQWNVLRALSHLELFLKRNKERSQTRPQSAPQENFRASSMGSDWFSFASCGMLIPRNSIAKDISPDDQATITSVLKNVSKMDNTRKTNRELLRMEGNNPESLRHIVKAAKHLTQAVVLSCRGRCWGLLQNSTCQLWNMRQTLEPIANDPSSFVSEESLQEILWRAFYHAADALLDMTVLINKDKKVNATKKQSRSTVVPTSWGDIDDEKGGSDLIFEEYLDNQTFGDVVWIKRVVMYAMELLFCQKRWEKLADIVLRFNTLTRSRYAENVLPLLAIAQKKLVERAEEHGGVSINQPDIAISPTTGEATGVTISVGTYGGIDTAAHIDPRGHDVYSIGNNALLLFSVPTDRGNTLEMLRLAAEQKHCAAKALQHSRQLLLRYLAGLSAHRRNISIISSGDQAVTSLPPDISEHLFEKLEDVQKFPLASSQLGVVITSYDKTIEMLQFHGRKALLAQAMTELGNIMHHIGNTKAAYKWWQAVLDAILAPSTKPNQQRTNNKDYHDVVHVAPALLLKKRGIWGCLLGAITAVNLARYIHSDNADKRLECCCVAATLVKALFASSLPHPIACCEYALYDIGIGYPVTTLIPGLNLFTDSFRCDVKMLLTSLVWLTEELLKTGHYLKVLPILTLARFIASDVFGDILWVFKVLLLRVCALTKANMFAQSYIVLNSLFAGTKRALKHHTNNLQDTSRFECNKPVTDATNTRALSHLISLRLPPLVAELYGREHSRDLIFEQARLMIAIASVVYAIPENAKEQLAEKLSVGTTSDTDLSRASTQCLGLFDENASASVVKSYLLAGAELVLDEIRDEILGGLTNLRDYLDHTGQFFNPLDFQYLIFIELEFATIRQQHLEPLVAAQMVFSCMRALEDSSVILQLDHKRLGSAWTVFSRSSDIAKTPELLRDNFTPPKSELDSHLWLTCRLKITECLSCEDNSLGRIAGFSRTVIALTGSCEQHCEQGMDETDAFGKTEMLVEFKMTSLLLRLKQGCLSEKDVEELKNAMDMLESFHPLSVKGRLMLGEMMIYYGDLISSFGGTKQDSVLYYEKAEKFLYDEMAKFGENVSKQGAFGCNAYLQHKILVAEIKLREGRKLAHMIDDSSSDESVYHALNVLNIGHNFASSMSAEQNPLDVEFLCMITSLQRILWLRGLSPETEIISSFFDAIMNTYNFDHDFELMKECYEQLALFYLAKIEQVEVHPMEAIPSSSSELSPQSSFTSRSSRKDDKTIKEKKSDSKSKLEKKKELKAAWFAIRAATSISTARHKCGLLPGDVTHLTISKETGGRIPLSVIHDILGATSIEEDRESGELCVGDTGVLTMKTYINNSNKVQMTWVHLLSHTSYLQRQISYPSLGIKDAEHTGPLFRWQKLLKLCQLRKMLRAELEVYSKTCSGYYPSNVLLLADVALYEKYYPSFAGSKGLEEASDLEVAIHWFLPGSDSDEPSSPDEPPPEQVQCLYAFNTKAVGGTSSKSGICAGTTVVPRKKLMAVHKRLQDLLEVAETNKALSTSAKAETPTTQVSSGTNLASSRKKRSSTSSKPSRGSTQEQIQQTFKECLGSVTALMKPDKQEKPFEASIASIRVLESAFDPSRGFVGKVPDKLHSWLLSLFM